MSDNFHFDLTGVPLSKCLDIAFVHEKAKAVGWAEVPINPDLKSWESVWGASQGKRRLILFKFEHKEMTKFPAPVTAEQAKPFIEAWLSEADYGPQPDHDGDNGRGYRVYNEAWGHVNGCWEAFVAIEPVWLLYGK